jgi:4-amino-4-deoxy-L-arabinose transferase-like glycosyltransferase
MSRSTRRVLLIGLGALVWRIVYVVVWGDDPLPFGDGLYYHLQAVTLADGHGFLEPIGIAFLHGFEATAKHPPLYALVLASVTRVGRALHLGHSDATIVHQVASAFLSSAGVVAIGLAARRVAGSRAAVAAALLAAVYPALWVNDALVMSESIVVLTTALFLLAVFAYLDRPSMGRAVGVGATIGLAVLARSEALALVLVVVVPLVLARRAMPRRVRFSQLAVALGVTALLLMPWIVRNFTAFDQPVFLTTNLDSVFAGANCSRTYSGPEMGGWDITCNASKLSPGDESVVGQELRRRGLNYIHHHPGRVPVVVAARIGRTFEVFRPLDDDTDEGRKPWTEVANLIFFFPTQLLAIVGVVRLRRAGRIVWPLLAVFGVTVAVTALTYGITRFRVGWDVASMMLAAAAVTGVSNREAHDAPDVETNDEIEPAVST